jgi:hypothetical protein
VISFRDQIAQLSFTLLVSIVSPGALLQNSGGISIPDAGPGSGLWLTLLARPVGVTTQERHGQG